MEKTGAGSRRRNAVFAFLRPFARLITSMRCRLTLDKSAWDLKPPFIVVANHVTDFDMLYIGLMFKESVRFVCSEDYVCGSPFAKLLKGTFNVIPFFKAGKGVRPTKEMLKALKEGDSICLFPEGRHSPDGRTGPFKNSVASLAKAAGCTVVTVRIDGYFVNPRWSHSNRRGPVRADVAGVYTAEQVASMTADELLDVIRKDISVDAYAIHRGKKDYRGKDTAQRLEESYFICPECGSWYTIGSHGDGFGCSCCGAEGTIDADGVISGGFRFDKLTDWWDWEWEELERRADEAPDEVITDSGEVRMQELDAASGSILPLGTVKLSATARELRFGDEVREFSRLPMMSLRNGPTLLLEDGKHHYEFPLDGKCGDVYRMLSLIAHRGEWYRYEGEKDGRQEKEGSAG